MPPVSERHTFRFLSSQAFHAFLNAAGISHVAGEIPLGLSSVEMGKRTVISIFIQQISLVRNADDLLVLDAADGLDLPQLPECFKRDILSCG